MEFLQDFRRSLGKTQAEMAEILGFSKSYYEKIESGDREPSREFMEAFKYRFPEFDMNIFFNNQQHDTCENNKPQHPK